MSQESDDSSGPTKRIKLHECGEERHPDEEKETSCKGRKYGKPDCDASREEKKSPTSTVFISTRSSRRQKNEPFLVLDGSIAKGSGPLTQLHVKVRHGEAYQVDPKLMDQLEEMSKNASKRTDDYEGEERLWLSEDTLPPERSVKITKYLDEINRLQIESHDLALARLIRLDYNFEAALAEAKKTIRVEDYWSAEEIVQFKYCQQRYGKIFHKYKTLLNNKSTQAIVDRYFKYKHFDKMRSNAVFNEPLSHVDIAHRAISKPFFKNFDDVECTNCGKVGPYYKKINNTEVNCEYCCAYKEAYGNTPSPEFQKKGTDEELCHEILKMKINGLRKKLMSDYVREKKECDSDKQNDLLFPISKKTPLQRHYAKVEKMAHVNRTILLLKAEQKKLLEVAEHQKERVEISYMPVYGNHPSQINTPPIPNFGDWREWEQKLQEAVFELCIIFGFDTTSVVKELRGGIDEVTLLDFIPNCLIGKEHAALVNKS
uniref:ELM2 domain-containing protein n=1 Tax=Rhabditophanes sp. KR3021 TaxID=114890 RepID=A0AC35TUV5_9BILA